MVHCGTFQYYIHYQNNGIKTSDSCELWVYKLSKHFLFNCTTPLSDTKDGLVFCPDRCNMDHVKFLGQFVELMIAINQPMHHVFTM